MCSKWIFILKKMLKAQIRLVAVEEAHCVSEWLVNIPLRLREWLAPNIRGDEFQKDYRMLFKLRDHLTCPFMVLTATATTNVMESVCHRIGLRKPVVVLRSIKRANMFSRKEKES